MDIPQFIGFLISIAAIGYLFLRQVWEVRQRQKDPEAYEKKLQEKEKRIKEFMRGLDIDQPEEKIEKPIPKGPAKGRSTKHLNRPAPPPILAHQSLAKVPPRHSFAIPKIAVPTYHVRYMESAPSRGKTVIRRLHTRQDMVVLHEIFGPPKGLLNDPWHHEKF